MDKRVILKGIFFFPVDVENPKSCDSVATFRWTLIYSTDWITDLNFRYKRREFIKNSLLKFTLQKEYFRKKKSRYYKCHKEEILFAESWITSWQLFSTTEFHRWMEGTNQVGVEIDFDFKTLPLFVSWLKI